MRAYIVPILRELTEGKQWDILSVGKENNRGEGTMKYLRKYLFNRIVIIDLAILLQLAFFINMLLVFRDYSNWFYGISLLISAVVVLWIVYNDTNPAYKIAWIIPILLVPIFGGIFYLAFGGSQLNRKEKKKMVQVETRTKETIRRNDDLLGRMSHMDPYAASQSAYIQNYAYYPPYEGTKSVYLSTGEAKFQRMLEELEKAEAFIFLEYFIIDEGHMWDSILDVLERKAKAGVDVRVIFDDFGCLLTLPYPYHKKLEDMGIKCCVFNPISPVLSTKFNTRDHRKITVVDGRVAFTGGVNLADEYINEIERFGHWKDMAILIEGRAVWSFTVMFLTLWDYLRGTETNFHAFEYRETTTGHPASEITNVGGLKGGQPLDSLGIVQPFSDNPLDNEPVSESVYLNLITKAKRYVYITTPYLIIDYGMVVALCNAAKSGIDVRIMTPHKPDKWYVHEVSRATYYKLLQSGVRIFEYTPGFIHGKTFVVDDEYAVVGTINMDYRSLYLHFECGVWLYKTQSVFDVKKDFEQTMEHCIEMTQKEYENMRWYRWLLSLVLKLFSPLM